jgi:hypothetical protein
MIPHVNTTEGHNVTPTDPDQLLRDTQAAELLDHTPRALADWRRRGCGPPYVRISCRSIRYRRRDLVTWAESRLRTSTSDPDPEQAA